MKNAHFSLIETTNAELTTNKVIRKRMMKEELKSYKDLWWLTADLKVGNCFRFFLTKNKANCYKAFPGFLTDSDPHFVLFVSMFHHKHTCGDVALIRGQLA